MVLWHTHTQPSPVFRTLRKVIGVRWRSERSRLATGRFIRVGLRSAWAGGNVICTNVCLSVGFNGKWIITIRNPRRTSCTGRCEWTVARAARATASLMSLHERCLGEAQAFSRENGTKGASAMRFALRCQCCDGREVVHRVASAALSRAEPSCCLSTSAGQKSRAGSALISIDRSINV